MHQVPQCQPMPGLLPSQNLGGGSRPHLQRRPGLGEAEPIFKPAQLVGMEGRSLPFPSLEAEARRAGVPQVVRPHRRRSGWRAMQPLPAVSGGSGTLQAEWQQRGGGRGLLGSRCEARQVVGLQGWEKRPLWVPQRHTPYVASRAEAAGVGGPDLVGLGDPGPIREWGALGRRRPTCLPGPACSGRLSGRGPAIGTVTSLRAWA